MASSAMVPSVLSFCASSPSGSRAVSSSCCNLGMTFIFHPAYSQYTSYCAKAKQCLAHARASGLEPSGPALRTAAHALKALCLYCVTGDEPSPDVLTRPLERNRNADELPITLEWPRQDVWRWLVAGDAVKTECLERVGSGAESRPAWLQSRSTSVSGAWFCFCTTRCILYICRMKDERHSQIATRRRNSPRPTWRACAKRQH